MEQGEPPGSLRFTRYAGAEWIPSVLLHFSLTPAPLLLGEEEIE